MKKHLWKFGVVLATCTPLILFLLYTDAREKDNRDESVEQQEKIVEEEYNLIREYEKIEEEEEIIIIEHVLAEAAWIPPWDYTRGVSSVDNRFYAISPVTFTINNDGSLTPRLDSNLTQLKTTTQDWDIKILPTISNFDWKQMQGIFEDSEKTQRHIDSIVNVAEQYNYDGIDLDYESLALENKQDFLNFIEILSKELGKNEKLLSVTVLPQWGTDINYTSFAGTRKTQDWEHIGQHADKVRIMTYDFTSSSSSRAGPIAPIAWMEEVLEYAVEKIPKEKVWLGIHLYSYEWIMPTNDFTSKPIKTNSYTYDTVINQILKKDNIHIQYNEDFEEGYADYPCQNDNYCLLYYATPQSIEARKDLAKKYEIAGVVYWRLGGEGDILD